MGILRGTLKGIAIVCLFSHLAFAEDGSEAVAEISHDSQIKKEDRPVDNSKIMVFKETFSRGNDDRYENRFGVYETALLRNKIITKLENGKLDVWIEVEPEFSTSHVKEASTAACFGLLGSELMKSHEMNPEELAQKKKQLEAEEAKKIELKKQQAEEQKASLKQTLLAKEDNKRELQSLQEKLESEHEAKKAENQETIERLGSLIEQALAAKKDPKAEERLKKLPVEHLRQLLKEAQTKKESLKETPSAIEENAQGISRLESSIDEYQSRIKEIEKRKFEPAVINLSSKLTRVEKQADGFKPFAYQDPAFQRGLAYGQALNPQGQKLRSVVYAGSVKLLGDRPETVKGDVSILMKGTSCVKHRFAYDIKIKDGEIQSGQFTPVFDPGMLRRVAAEVTQADGRVQENPYQLPLTDPFIPKPMDKLYPKTAAIAKDSATTSGKANNVPTLAPPEAKEKEVAAPPTSTKPLERSVLEASPR